MKLCKLIVDGKLALHFSASHKLSVHSLQDLNTPTSQSKPINKGIKFSNINVFPLISKHTFSFYILFQDDNFINANCDKEHKSRQFMMNSWSSISSSSEWNVQNFLRGTFNCFQGRFISILNRFIFIQIYTALKFNFGLNVFRR